MNPSYRIVFYVSGHGFGHASRAIEVIRAVLRAQPDAHVVVKTSAPPRLFTRALQGQCEVVELECDPGMVQADSLNLDAPESIRRAVEFQRRLPALAAAESAYLRDAATRVAVGDIPPLAAAAAHLAGIPSVMIGNFTWDWIYEGYHSPDAQAVARDIKRLYRDATVALRLPMAGGFEGLEPITRNIPFIARQSQRTQDDVRRALGLPPRAAGKPLVLMSFGGYGVSGLDTAALANLTPYSVATTDLSARTSSRAATGELLYISEQDVHNQGLLYEDLVRGADVVVTKPGYGIISEAIANGPALLYTSRGDFVEYDLLVNEMPRYLRVRFIEQERLLKGDWLAPLEALLSQPPPPERPALNGAEIAAEEVLKLVRKNE
jgi:UDP:flavonoid glycosyltransferase YjiC (YdhE family)